MNFNWEYLCSRHWTVARASEEEKAAYNELRSKETFTREEVLKILEENAKCIASKFEGPVTLINSNVVKSLILNSHEYRLNLFPESLKL